VENLAYWLEAFASDLCIKVESTCESSHFQDCEQCNESIFGSGMLCIRCNIGTTLKNSFDFCDRNSMFFDILVRIFDKAFGET